MEPELVLLIVGGTMFGFLVGTIVGFAIGIYWY
jgi:hypothetical protein